MTDTATTRRPALITVLVVFVVLSGIGAALTAWITLSTPGSAMWVGIVQVVLALAYFAVAKGLFNGNPTARLVAAAAAAAQIILVIVVNTTLTSATGQGVATATTDHGTWRVGSLVFPVLALIILFTPKANAFFGSRR